MVRRWRLFRATHLGQGFDVVLPGVDGGDRDAGARRLPPDRAGARPGLDVPGMFSLATSSIGLISVSTSHLARTACGWLQGVSTRTRPLRAALRLRPPRRLLLASVDTPSPAPDRIRAALMSRLASDQQRPTKTGHSGHGRRSAAADATRVEADQFVAPRRPGFGQGLVRGRPPGRIDAEQAHAFRAAPRGVAVAMNAWSGGRR